MSEATARPDAARRVLVACVGNIFLGDDGFGVAVAERLRGRRFPSGVTVAEFGIRGVDLAYTLLDDGYDTLVLVDAVPRGGPPGTLYLLETQPDDPDASAGLAAGRAALDGHSMDPVKVLAFARALGAPPIRTLVVGCEPAALGGDPDGAIPLGLSEPVRAAVERAAAMIDALVGELCPASA